ncbi:hypothetical protein [Marinimicrobium alkaliphilum]|uniref:hypothetical protein n=1 Tax=Marinimicrobium alkaliphilum TaxID=2202654 RepID=UPI000DBACC8D|nr:hypothetical protein [Marinimicrobium alkaliphilum]
MIKTWWSKALLLALAAALMSACGASRDEPFNPAEPEEEDPDPVAMEFWFDGAYPFDTLDGEARRVYVVRDLEEYWEWYDTYFIDDNSAVGDPNFETGQIVVVDGGLIDECNDHVALQSGWTAEQTSDDVVTVELIYQFVDAVSCDDNEESLYRPFTFLYVNTRDPVIIRERLN